MRFFDGVRDIAAWVRESRSTLVTFYLALIVYLIMTSGITFLLIVSPLLVKSSNALAFGLGVLTYNYGYLLSNCHQLPERSLFLFGGQVPLCARDVGMYVGCILGVLLPFLPIKVPKFLKSKRFLFILLLPLVFDGVTQTLLFWRESSNSLRVVTGVLFGLAVTYFISTRILDLTTQFEFDRKALWKRSLMINLFLFLLLLIPSYTLGSSFTAKDKVIGMTGEIANPSAVYYVPPRASYTLPSDPYLKNYDDAVLTDLYHSIGSNNRDGIWVVAYITSIAPSSKQFAYSPPADGTFYYFDSKTGSIIAKIAHKRPTEA